jgi:hypothetical protein
VFETQRRKSSSRARIVSARACGLLPDIDARREAGSGIRDPGIARFDDESHVIEMSFVRPPFVLDFASATLDAPPDFSHDEGHTLEDLVRERFDESKVDRVMELYYELGRVAGVYVSDLNPHNIKFE